MNSYYILDFSSEEATLSSAGGKGANLAELARAGFDVPPGFILTTDAYKAFVSHNAIEDDLPAIVRSASHTDPASLEVASSQISALFARGTMPHEIAEAIDSAYAQLAARTNSAQPPVAVRSSATAEDLPGLSFAGQQETYLNVVGADAVREAVKRCWASLWTARAIGYRARNAIAPEDVALAVVVQQMVDAEAAGVAFTANPLTGRRSEIVIDASFGLGEAVVSGQVEPDHYIVSSPTGPIANRKLGSKALAVVLRPGGGTETVLHSGNGHIAVAQRQALSDEQIVELASTAHRVAQHFGSPQDLEWALQGGRLYVLQSRPITSLYPLPRVRYAPHDLHVYASVNSIQGVIEPFTPLGRSALTILLGGGLGRVFRVPQDKLLVQAAGRLFIDLSDVVFDPHLRRVVLAAMARVDPGAHQALVRLLEEGQVPDKQLIHPMRVPALLFRARHLLARLIRTMRNPEAGRRRALAAAEAYVAKVEQHAAEAKDLRSLLASMQKDLGGFLPRVMAQMIRFVPGIFGIFVVDRWLVNWLGKPPGSALNLLRGAPGNVTTAMDLKLWAAAQVIRSDDAASWQIINTPVKDLTEAYRRGRLTAVAQVGMEQFLSEYGKRAVAEIDIGRPRWREDPSSIFQTLQSYLLQEDQNLAPDLVFQRGAEEAERFAAECAAQLRRTHRGAVRARLFTAMVHRIRILAGLREAPKFYIIGILDAYRTALLEHGRRLAESGDLEQAEDIFFVPLEELKRFAEEKPVDLKATVAAERAEYDREWGRRQLPRMLLSTGEVFYAGVRTEATDGSENVLVGDPVSPGTIEGTVRVVLDPRGARLEPGEILVCPATDPGWTPLFLSAGGLIMEVGGVMTHGSVVAREYGIPAVVGVHDATNRLQTGQRVSVDGGTGRVTLLDDPGSE